MVGDGDGVDVVAVLGRWWCGSDVADPGCDALGLPAVGVGDVDGGSDDGVDGPAAGGQLVLDGCWSCGRHERVCRSGAGGDRRCGAAARGSWDLVGHGAGRWCGRWSDACAGGEAAGAVAGDGDVADDGGVTPGFWLRWYARVSPVQALQIAAKRIEVENAIKLLLAKFEAADRDTGHQLRKVGWELA